VLLVGTMAKEDVVDAAVGSGIDVKLGSSPIRESGVHTQRSYQLLYVPALLSIIKFRFRRLITTFDEARRP
jgi:hypothetical protein